MEGIFAKGTFAGQKNSSKKHRKHLNNLRSPPSRPRRRVSCRRCCGGRGLLHASRSRCHICVILKTYLLSTQDTAVIGPYSSTSISFCILSIMSLREEQKDCSPRCARSSWTIAWLPERAAMCSGVSPKWSCQRRGPTGIDWQPVFEGQVSQMACGSCQTIDNELQ